MSITAAPAARPEARPPVTDDDERCEVCPHPVGDHDAIGLRFCTATMNADLDRGCVCRCTGRPGARTGPGDPGPRGDDWRVPEGGR